MPDGNIDLAPDRLMNVLIAKIRALGTDFFTAFEGRVRYGHFRGYRMLPESSWSKTDLAAKLFGLYEKEVLDQIYLNKDRFEHAVILGAADGYYAVGLVSSGIVERSVCFETSPHGQDVIRKTAALNGVADKISIFGSAGADFLDTMDLPDDRLRRSLFVIDIEGGEFSILTHELIRRLRHSHVMIELHSGMVPGGAEHEKCLLEGLQEHFDIEILTTGARDLSAMTELSYLSDNIRWLVCSEGRPHRMRWVYCTPKTSADAEHGIGHSDAAALAPLLYFCAFGEPYFKEAIVSIRSWREIGGYTGQIMLFCDATWDVDAALGVSIEDLGIDMVVIDGQGQKMKPRDTAAFRLRIFEHVVEPRLFIYCDTDIICIAQVSLPNIYDNCDLSKVNVYGYGTRNQDAITQAAFVTDDPAIISSKAMCSGFIVFTRRARGNFAEILHRYAHQKTSTGAGNSRCSTMSS